MIREAIARLVAGEDLTPEEAEGALHAIMAGEASGAQTGAFLAALAAKGATVAEVAGCARAMRRHATPVSPSRRPLVDTAGTGGDGSGTFNISTAAAFVMAGAGAVVAKHGNRSATSRCGSADVLEALGVRLDLPSERIAAAIDQVGIGFLFAQSLHGAMRHVGPARREIGVPTVFNLLGPLTNPAGAERQVVGVARPDLVPLVAGALMDLGTERSLVIHGAGGVDEATLAGPVLVTDVEGGRSRTYEVDPGTLGLGAAPLSALGGGDPAENARIFTNILEGETGPRRDAVLFNASLGLMAAGVARNPGEGVEAARQAIDSGRALSALRTLVAFGRETPA